MNPRIMSAHAIRLPAALAAVAILALVTVLAPAAAGSPDQGADPRESDLPVFEFSGIVTDKEDLEFNPNDEFIFPSLFHAGEHLEDPLGEWYLYYAPHDPPGGIAMMYADSLDGPWTEHPGSPLIANEWPPHYDWVSHVSTPEPFWHPEEERMIMYFHGENSQTRYAYSDDGVSFEYGGIAVENADGPQGTTESSYARVFEHPDPDSEYGFAMFYMRNERDDIRRIAVAESVDGREWDTRQEPLIVPGFAEGQNVSSANLWEWEGQLYVIYHASSGNIHARTIDETLTETGPAWTLHSSSGEEPDVGRVAAPEIVTHEGQTYLFYEGGHRLGATIAYARHRPGVERPPAAEPDPDPLRETCAGPGSDDFGGDALDSGQWSMVRGDDARHELADGQLLVPTYPSGVSGASFPLQDVPAGAWEVTAEVTVEVTERFQQAGLLLYRDDDNYAKLILGEATGGPRLEFIWRQDGTDRHAGADTMIPPGDLGPTFWLRLSGDGETARASVSPDGRTFWSLGREVDLFALAPEGVGPFAMRGATEAPEIDAAFGWFRWTPSAEDLTACEDEPGPEDPDEEGPAGQDPDAPSSGGPGSGGDMPDDAQLRPGSDSPQASAGETGMADAATPAGALATTGVAGAVPVLLLAAGLVLAGLAVRRRTVGLRS